MLIVDWPVLQVTKYYLEQKGALFCFILLVSARCEGVLKASSYHLCAVGK